MYYLLHGTRLDSLEEIQNHGFFRASKAVFLLNQVPLIEETLIFTLAIACFHAVGLNRWQMMAEFQDTTNEKLAFIIAQPVNLRDFQDNQEQFQFYEGINWETSQKTSSLPYVRIREIGPISIKAQTLNFCIYPVNNIGKIIEKDEIKPTMRFFNNSKSAKSMIIPLETSRICHLIAREVFTSVELILV